MSSCAINSAELPGFTLPPYWMRVEAARTCVLAVSDHQGIKLIVANIHEDESDESEELGKYSQWIFETPGGEALVREILMMLVAARLGVPLFVDAAMADLRRDPTDEEFAKWSLAENEERSMWLKDSREAQTMHYLKREVLKAEISSGGIFRSTPQRWENSSDEEEPLHPEVLKQPEKLLALFREAVGMATQNIRRTPPMQGASRRGVYYAVAGLLRLATTSGRKNTRRAKSAVDRITTSILLLRAFVEVEHHSRGFWGDQIQLQGR